MSWFIRHADIRTLVYDLRSSNFSRQPRYIEKFDVSRKEKNASFDKSQLVILVNYYLYEMCCDLCEILKIR